ncbi:MAG: histidine phosphatase family protein [Erysipelotrichaceae bacterium]|nr:histidine phosphatase family protein [Erysipelotrichaceae bacterium]
MIILMRHGQTQLNTKHLLQGRSDLPLNETGIRQARQAGDWFVSQGLSFSRVFASPYRRAIATAQLASQQEEIVLDARLSEMDYGPYEGHDLTHPSPEIVTFFSDFVHNPAPAGMESLQEVVTRTGQFLEEIKEETGNVLVCTHAVAMKGCLESIDPVGTYWSYPIANCALFALERTNGQWAKPVEIQWKDQNKTRMGG